MFEWAHGVLDSVGQLVAVKVELLKLRDLGEGVLRGLDVRDQVLLQVKMLEARQSSEDVSLDNLNLISLIKEKNLIFSSSKIFVSTDLQIERVDLFAELPAVILDVVHLVVTQTQDLEGYQSVKPALIDRHDLSGIKEYEMMMCLY